MDYHCCHAASDHSSQTCAVTGALLVLLAAVLQLSDNSQLICKLLQRLS